jgi:hypothetical protein
MWGNWESFAPGVLHLRGRQDESDNRPYGSVGYPFPVP